MEELDRALERQSQRLNPNILQAAVVKSADDIKRLLIELDPNRSRPQKEIQISTKISVDNVTYDVHAPTRSKSKRELLIEGLSVVKNRADVADRMVAEQAVEVNGVKMRSARIGNSLTGEVSIDPLIRHWLGGYRDGLLICWDFNDGFIYRYDIWTHKLSRIQKES